MPIRKHSNLIFVHEVRELIDKKVKFKCRYDLVGFSTDGCPRYTCIYFHNKDGEDREEILTTEKQTKRGTDAKVLQLWPGLIKHHRKWGDGSTLCIGPDDIITTNDLRGRNDVPVGRKSKH